MINSILWGDNLLLIMRNLLRTLEREDVPKITQHNNSRFGGIDGAAEGEKDAEEFNFVGELFSLGW